MIKTTCAAFLLAALTGHAFADIREIQTFVGPYGIYALDNPRSTTLSVPFTGVDNGAPYQATGLLMVMDLTSNFDLAFGSDLAIRVTPPTGPAFDVFPSDEGPYETILNATIDVRLPAGAVGATGTWTFRLYTQFEFDGGIPDAYISNVQIALQDLPPLPILEPLTDLGVLGATDITSTTPDYNGVDPAWFKITLPEPVSNASGFYFDVNTIGTDMGPGATGFPNDTMLAVFDANGFLYKYSNDIAYFDDSAIAESSLTFGSSTPARDHGVPIANYNGHNGDLLAGDYYIAAGAYRMNFADGFRVNTNSISSGGSLVVNVYGNFGAPPTACSLADVGVAGGGPGQDRRLDNNDFIAFITHFFAQNTAADLGIAGGLPGHDGVWDNNDFIAFITYFFNDTAGCTG